VVDGPRLDKEVAISAEPFLPPLSFSPSFPPVESRLQGGASQIRFASDICVRDGEASHNRRLHHAFFPPPFFPPPPSPLQHQEVDKENVLSQWKRCDCLFPPPPLLPPPLHSPLEKEKNGFAGKLPQNF